ncbi:unnamed protein product [Caenorhabditis bovis]|uniref:non-specific serine/threonine protein kinase n=1 Tax=Caenorhabditis bovis TaxID=2654633 RepID=A0A8S1E7S3_9PELO|nr:unnamed protein product [Caenorhabditis bovis]
MDCGGTSTEYVSKFIVPEETTISQRVASDSGKFLKMSVDPDFDDAFSQEDETHASIPLTREHIQSTRRTKEARQGGGVKMSIGNCDEEVEEEDDDETDEMRSKRIAQQMKRFREQDKEEDFDIPELNLNDDDDAMKAYFRQRVENLFSNDNALGLDDEPVEFKKPKILEGYLWGAVIGGGSYGKVKEVIDTYSLTRRAVKIMKHDKIRKIPNGAMNIRNEIRILNTLKHKNIVKLVEVFEVVAKKRIYMIFEYCIGSVQQLLELEPARRITVGEAHLIFCETVRGLDYLHALRISHKDIKPGNLLIAIDFTVKICDFGVAEQLSLFQNNGNCTKVNGTPKFQPPECVAGSHEYFDGYKADMWGLGVTLYNMVSGKYPFDKTVLIQLYDSIAKDPVEMPKNVELSPHLQDLILKLLEKDFKIRYGTYETMLHPWYITMFPEDQGLGRIMERLRTGDRPLTMQPSMKILYDEQPQDQDSIIPILTEGGQIDRSTFDGFLYLEADENEPMDETVRPSSRSNPTSAPRHGDGAVSRNSRRRTPNIFKCLMRNRTHSS